MGPDQPLRFLKGVGPARCQQLATLGLETVWDLLHMVGRCLGDAPDEIEEGPLPLGEAIQIRARVKRVAVQRSFRGRRGSTVNAHLETADGRGLMARFFNAGYLRDKMPAGEWFLFEGNTDAKKPGILNHPRFTHLRTGGDDTLQARQGCEVAYPTPEGMGARFIAGLIERCLADLASPLNDPLGSLEPSVYTDHLRRLHAPHNADEFEESRRIIAERELTALAMLLKRRRDSLVEHPGRSWGISATIEERARARLPFALTKGQEQAWAHIRGDMQTPSPMYRLLQGDVGSGKTALAFLASLAVVAEGSQVLVLAPTAILARQHYRFFSTCLEQSKVRMGLLTGATKEAERRPLLDALNQGTVDILVGTHALLESAIQPADLGLAIIDEQHKFGVEQRLSLTSKSAKGRCDLLLLTATPIPRTLALTCFGDLAVSPIEGKPPGRQSVATTVDRMGFATVVQAAEQTLAEQGCLFIVTPLKEESDVVKAVSAKALAKDLSDHFGTNKVSLIHGDLKEAEKNQIIDGFGPASCPILVSTTVVEVGVDVPEATMMVVCNAERFGLAQLHQLRGRIGRGERPGTCLLLAADPEGCERLQILSESDDGLAIAEADLAQRGPGEFLGTRQSGLPPLRVADLSRDVDLLQRAHAKLAQGNLTLDPHLWRLLPAGHRPEAVDAG